MGMQFDVYVNLPNKKIQIKNIKIKLLGIHNILNVVATLAIGLLLNISIKKSKNLYLVFRCTKKINHCLQNKGTIIYDDYAHHPTEIKAVLEACRKNFKNKKIIAIFQPHRYSRMKFYIVSLQSLFLMRIKFSFVLYIQQEKKIKSLDFKNFAKM